MKKQNNKIILSNKKINEKITIYVLLSNENNRSYEYNIIRKDKIYHCNDSSKLMKFIGDLENKLEFKEEDNEL